MNASDFIPEDAPPRVKMGVLCKWFGVSPSCIVHWVAIGRIPPPVRVGERTHYYLTEKIRAALKAEEANGGPKKRKAKQR